MPTTTPPRRLLRNLCLPVFAVALFLVAPASVAQIPDEFKNLKVLPENISKGELVGTMRGFASGLGVRCSHCHPGPDNLQGMDFASDELETKQVARAMLKMTRAINETLLPATKRESLTRVECVTCHRGLTDPRSLAGVLMEVVGESGVPGAVEHYRELRQKYHGTGSYDFAPGTLHGMAETLAQDGRDLDGAIALLRLNVEFNPDAALSHLLLGQLYASRGDNASAGAALRRVLELEPDNRRARQALEALQKPE